MIKKLRILILILLIFPIGIKSVNAQTLQQAQDELRKLKKDAETNRVIKEKSQAEILQLQQQIWKLK